MELDKKNRQLLNLLYLNSRESFVRLGRKLKLSSLSVERRLASLQKEGIIELLHANVNRAKLGFSEYRLFFKFDVMDSGTEAEVLQLFESYPRTGWGVIAEGEYEVLWRIYARDEFEVEKAVFLMMEKFGRKIVEKTVVTTIYEAYFTWDKAFGTERIASFPERERHEEEEIDKEDMGILRELFSDSRAKIASIAKRVGLTPDTVGYRVKRLRERGILTGYTAWFDPRKLGFNYYKILFWFQCSSIEDEQKFVRYCMAKSEVVYLVKTMGGWDMEIDVVVRNNGELHDLTRDIKTKFGRIIGRHAFITVVAERTRNPLREYL